MHRVQAFCMACQQGWGPFDEENRVEIPLKLAIYFVL